MKQPIRIVLPNHFDNSTVNAWLLKGAVNTLVDTGMKSEKTWDALVEQLDQHGLRIQDLDSVVITHGHADHMGLAAKIAEVSGAPIWVPEYLYPWAINLEEKINQRAKIYDEAFYSNCDTTLFPYESWDAQRLMQFWDPIPQSSIVTFKMDAFIQMGDQVWETIYTPGHCINQVVFYQPESKYLLSADMILHSTPVPYLDSRLDQPNVRTSSLRLLLDSFQKVADLDIEQVFPGHFDQMTDPTLLIQKQVNRIRENIDKTLNWIRSGHNTFPKLIHKLYPQRVNDSTFFMLVGILDYLVEDELIECRKTGDYLEYFPLEETILSVRTNKSTNNEF